VRHSGEGLPKIQLSCGLHGTSKWSQASGNVYITAKEVLTMVALYIKLLSRMVPSRTLKHHFVVEGLSHGYII
jgi:hypothetical protein